MRDALATSLRVLFALLNRPPSVSAPSAAQVRPIAGKSNAKTPLGCVRATMGARERCGGGAKVTLMAALRALEGSEVSNQELLALLKGRLKVPHGIG